MDIDSLPDNLRTAILEELEPGETIAWLDRPGRGANAGIKIAIVLFGLFYTGFSLALFAQARWLGPPELAEFMGPMQMLAAVSVLLGFGLLAIPVWMSWLSRSTVLVITDRRVFIVGRMRSKWITTITPDAIGMVVRTQKADGSGSIRFGPPAKDGLGGRAFQGIAEVKRVEMLLRDLAATAHGRSTRPADFDEEDRP